jgi:hypothetical protein
MLNFVRREPGLVISLLIQPNHEVYVVLFEDRDVILGREDPPSVGVLRGRARATERQKLVRDDSIHIPILDSLIEVVGVEVESFHVKPAELDRSFEATQAVVDLANKRKKAVYGALVAALTQAGVSEGLKLGGDVLELCPGVVGVHLEDEDHEGAHEVAGVGALGGVEGGPVENLVLLVLRVLDELLELGDEAVGLPQVERPEVRVERYVDQLL